MFPNDVSESTKDLIVWMMEPNKDDRPQRVLDATRKLNQTKVNRKDMNCAKTDSPSKSKNDDTAKIVMIFIFLCACSVAVSYVLPSWKDESLLTRIIWSPLGALTILVIWSAIVDFFED